jgi:PPK2 family polyphosphate:nucleotide phosphotransferase
VDIHRIAPGADVDLAAIDTRATSGFEKDHGKDRLKDLNDRLEHLQELLYAEGEHKLLIVLQGMDTSGKDGTIRHVFEGVNPQGVKVASFKKPTEQELSHDYLWRVHRHTPGSGEIVIFNRSHYEDVLVVRVLGLVPEERWRKRYDHIVEFERLLADEGTTILKFFLHISRDEQKERLQARLDDPSKHWKFSVGDLATRRSWDEYTAAYTEMLERTSTEHAPWFVVPADRKWHRNLVIAETMVSTLEGLEMGYPPPEDDLSGVVIP